MQCRCKISYTCNHLNGASNILHITILFYACMAANVYQILVALISEITTDINNVHHVAYIIYVDMYTACAAVSY